MPASSERGVFAGHLAQVVQAVGTPGLERLVERRPGVTQRAGCVQERLAVGPVQGAGDIATAVDRVSVAARTESEIDERVAIPDADARTAVADDVARAVHGPAIEARRQEGHRINGFRQRHDRAGQQRQQASTRNFSKHDRLLLLSE